MRRWFVIVGVIAAAALVAGAITVRSVTGSAILRTWNLDASFTAGTLDTSRGRVIIYGSDRTGWRLWTLRTDLSAALLPLHTVPSPGGIAVDTRQGRLFLPSGDSTRVNMLDASSGAILRTVSVGSWPQGLSYMTWRPIIACERTGRVFVATFASRTPNSPSAIAMLDARTGHVQRTVTVGHNLVQMAVDERTERLFALNMWEGTVSVLDARNGALLTTVPVGRDPTSVAIDERQGTVLVTTGYGGGLVPFRQPAQDLRGVGSVSVIDARTGVVRRTIPVGVSPVAVVVDEQKAYAFVLSSGGWVRPPDQWAWVPQWARSRIPFIPQAPKGTHFVPGSISVLSTRLST